MAAAAELFRRNGYTGTGLKQIVTQANAPFGSLYHFFPGGKEQLGEQVIRTSGLAYIQLFDLFIAPAQDLISGLEASFAAAAVTLEETGYADACPIATVALEVSTVETTKDRIMAAAASRSPSLPASRAPSCSAAQCVPPNPWPSRAPPPSPRPVPSWTARG